MSKAGERLIRAAQSARDWVKDAAHENGNYMNLCCHCGNTFTGHKRRVACRECVGKVGLDGKPDPV